MRRRTHLSTSRASFPGFETASDALGGQIRARLDALAAITEQTGRLTRTFLTPEHRQAGALVLTWMRDAGMATSLDAIGNVLGRYEGTEAGAPALVIGSHLDTVVDAGRYDGMLGVVSAIACVERLNAAGRRMPFPIEIVGFGDEEGVRFGTTMLGSRAMAGTFDPAFLALTDAADVTMADALRAYGLDPAAVPAVARRPGAIAAYVELHIEQGPVLESRGLPVGCVTAIAGATRLEVTVTGAAGHAGTVPMDARHDALAAAAECVLVVERRCALEDGLVGTVGRLSVEPGAINVIPGRVTFTIDARAPDDEQRACCVDDLIVMMEGVAAARRLQISARILHTLPATHCAGWIMDLVDHAIATEGVVPFRLASGAGHDGMALSAIAEIGMIFVRCAGGISHNPAESVTAEDCAAGTRVLMNVIENFWSGKRR